MIRNKNLKLSKKGISYDEKNKLILCASVSRFARNLTDLIERIDVLRENDLDNPIEVYFEAEQLSTLKSKEMPMLNSTEYQKKKAFMIKKYAQGGEAL